MTGKEAAEQKKTEQKAPEKQKEVQNSRPDNAALSAFLSLLQASETGTLRAELYAKEALSEGASVLGNQLFQNTLGGDGAALCEKPSPELFPAEDLPVNLIRTDVPAETDPETVRQLAFRTMPQGISNDPFRISDREETWYE